MSIFGLRQPSTASESTPPAAAPTPQPVVPLVTDAQLEALAEMVTRRVMAAVPALVAEAVRAQAAEAVAAEVPAAVREVATTLVREEIARIRERRS